MHSTKSKRILNLLTLNHKILEKNPFSVIIELLHKYWYVVVALIIALNIWGRIQKSARFIGRKGEKEVLSALRKLNTIHYHVLNDITIRSNYGTTQLDHIVISNFGLFVIETKNYSGWIFGSEHSTHWTQVIYRFKRKFYSPVLQVKGQARALRNLLVEFPQLNIIPIVVFTKNADLHVRNETKVLYTSQLVKSIFKYEEPNINELDKKHILTTIQAANLSNRKTKKQHIQHAKRQRRKFDNKVSNKICPSPN